MSDPYSYLAELSTTVSPEPPSDLHTEITHAMWEEVKPIVKLEKLDLVLDIGCGQGVALKMFEKEGMHAYGISASVEDTKACVRKGHACIIADMHRVSAIWKRPRFSLVWARHVFEHSPFPMLALREAHKVLMKTGHLYVEVPMPDTACYHEKNTNHYSVLGQRAWDSLIERSGFEIVWRKEIGFRVEVGPDMYYAVLGRKS